MRNRKTPAKFQPHKPDTAARPPREMLEKCHRAEAISAFRNILASRAKAAADVHTWIIQLQERQIGGYQLTVLEHTALTYILRSGFLSHHTDQDTRYQAVVSTLAHSWHHLTGQAIESRDVTNRLPWRVLRKAGREDRLFHAAAFQADGPKATYRAETLGRDYVPEMLDLAVIAGLLVAVLTDISGAVLGSALIGYSIASLAEYSMHRWVGHEAGKPILLLVSNLGWFGERVSAYLKATYWGHFVVHHIRTCNKNYTTQFSKTPPGDQATIDAELDGLGEAGSYIKRSNYGMTLSHEGVMAGILLTLPLNVLIAWVFSLNVLSITALITPSFMYVAASKFLHPYLHKDRTQALEQAGPLTRMLLETRYAEWISRAHWVHHKGGGGNFNLLPGADLLFGDLRKPNLGMILRMRDDCILGACWGNGR
jgi:hypothetical protein